MMNKNILIGLVVLLLLIAGGWYAWLRSEDPIIGIDQSSPRTSPSENSVSDASKNDFSGFKKYENEEYGFELQYPNYLTQFGIISGAVSLTDKHLITLGDNKTAKPDSDAPFDGFSIWVDTVDNIGFSDYIEREKEKLPTSYPDADIDGPFTGGVESGIIIGGQQSKILKGYRPYGITHVYIPFPDNKRVLVLSMNKTNSSKFDVVFNQILSTVEFSN